MDTFPCLTDFSSIMDDINLDIDGDPAAIAQQVAALAVQEAIEGIDLLLDAVGIQNPAEYLCLIKAGLAEYESFHYLIDKDMQDMAEGFLK